MSRRALKAGSWYEGDAKRLESQLVGWLAAAAKPEPHLARAVVSPHAGYSYSGSTAAYGFKQLNPKLHQRIFILGPSHAYYTQGCEVTGTSIYQTPLGDLPIDRAVIEELLATKLFGVMSRKVDEREHSIELQLPYIAHVMKGSNFTVVPILVGNLSAKAEATYGEVLAPYFKDPTNFFVISSDFCHWGGHFDYQPYNERDGTISQHIEKMDREGITIVESQDHGSWIQYLDRTKNTVCGRHPIGIFLQMVQHSKTRLDVRLLHYRQSSQCQDFDDSSVSYASIVGTEAAPDDEKQS